MDLQPAALRRACVVALAILVVAVGSAIVLRHMLRQHPAAPGKPLPVIALVGLDGAPASVRPQSGTILYNVFATWCVPCAMEAPTLAAATPSLRARGINIVGIDQGDSREAVRTFVQHYDLRYPVFIDDRKATNALLGARVIPETLLVRNGIVQEIYVGPLSPHALGELVAVNQ
ncbi:MAG TPA: TlpA disulfide reductase family protein [Candidatus Acidoferrum sp.]|nr:TlpA disulfide reductase family protein [Candidatus Acidoferrum sp.]